MFKMDPLLISYLVVFLFNILLAILVFSKNRKSLVNMLFGLYAGSLGFWNLSLFITIASTNGSILQLWWSRLVFSFGVLMIQSFLYFTIIYPKRKKACWQRFSVSQISQIFIIYETSNHY